MTVDDGFVFMYILPTFMTFIKKYLFICDITNANMNA